MNGVRAGVIAVLAVTSLLAGVHYTQDDGVKPYDPDPYVEFNYSYDATTHTITIGAVGGNKLNEERTDRLLVEIADDQSGKIISREWISKGTGYDNGGKGYPVVPGDGFVWSDPRIESGDVVRIVFEGRNGDGEQVRITFDETTVPSTNTTA